MGCGASSQDVLKSLFESNSRKSTILLDQSVKKVNTALQYEELQNKWACSVIANTVSQKFHEKITTRQISLVSYLYHELGYELKSTILFACDLLASKLLFDLKKLKVTPDHADLVSNFPPMFETVKMYLTILARQDSLTKDYAQLPFLLLVCLAELYHIFFSLCCLLEGSETVVWWYEHPEKEQQIQFKSYTKYLESLSGPVIAQGSSTLIDLKTTSQKKKKKTLIYQSTIFNRTKAYMSIYKQTTFQLFTNEFSKNISDSIKLYRKKNKFGDIILNESVSGISHARTDFDDTQNKTFMQNSQHFAQKVDDIRTGTILSASHLEETGRQPELYPVISAPIAAGVVINVGVSNISQLRPLRGGIGIASDEILLEDTIHRLSISKNVSKFDQQFEKDDDIEDEHPRNEVNYNNCITKKHNFNTSQLDFKDIVSSIYIPTQTTRQTQAFTACRTHKYFTSINEPQS